MPFGASITDHGSTSFGPPFLPSTCIFHILWTPKSPQTTVSDKVLNQFPFGNGWWVLKRSPVRQREARPCESPVFKLFAGHDCSVHLSVRRVWNSLSFSIVWMGFYVLVLRHLWCTPHTFMTIYSNNFPSRSSQWLDIYTSSGWPRLWGFADAPLREIRVRSKQCATSNVDGVPWLQLVIHLICCPSMTG